MLTFLLMLRSLAAEPNHQSAEYWGSGNAVYVLSGLFMAFHRREAPSPGAPRSA